ncbi:MAG: galactonate dehydratase [Chloroflexia bacterium]|nr:galactonate dehydratase [Chloroflexia bacterium]
MDATIDTAPPARPDLNIRVTEVIPHVLFAGRTNLIFVEVRTDAGITGLGEASLEGKTEAVVGAINDVADYLIGEDPTRIEHHWQTIYRHSFWRGGVVIGSAISGIEQALWDILGKALGVPVYELLGGRVRDRVRLYANGPRGETAEEIAESCLRLVDAGWGALKLAPFEAVPAVAGPRELAAARHQLRLIRDAVGPDVDVLIDCHGRLSPAAAIQMAEALEEFDIFFFEEPVLPEDPRAMAEVAARITIPVATGERLFTKWGFRDVLELGAADVLQPDIAHCGGILEARKIAAAAEVSFVAVAPHNPYSWLLTMASIQLDFATPNFLIQEFLVDHPPEVERLFAAPFTWLPGGWVEPPTAPGLGVELDWDAVRAHEARPYTRTRQPSLWHVDGSVAAW